MNNTLVINYKFNKFTVLPKLDLQNEIIVKHIVRSAKVNSLNVIKYLNCVLFIVMSRSIEHIYFFKYCLSKNNYNYNIRLPQGLEFGNTFSCRLISKYMHSSI